MKNKRYLILILITILPILVKAQYDVSQIPDSILKNADYVVWGNTRQFKITSTDKAVDHLKVAILITKNTATNFREIDILYNKQIHINNLSAAIYDATGKEIKKIKKSEISDLSYVSESSLFEDDRKKVIHFNNLTYPYTIEYEYEISQDGLISYPTHIFHHNYRTGVLSSSFQIEVPLDMEFKYKEFNIKNALTIKDNPKSKQYTWSMKNLIPIQVIDLAPSYKDYLPVVITEPTDFKMENFAGKMTSWQEFSSWNHQLNKDRRKLPETTINTIKELTKNATNDYDKIKAIYQYMQNKTRYVSVNLGIGGWQAFPAEYVDKNGYGDCKALTNYMLAMLSAVNIKSYYTLVNSGEHASDILTDFPSVQFNHAILCVPMPKDTLWLECTSQQAPFGFLGSFTDNRYALLIDSLNGKLVKTPRYTQKDNQQIRTAQVEIDINGNANINSKTKFSGLRYEQREGFKEISAKEQKDAINKLYEISGMNINALEYFVQKERMPSIIETLSLYAPKLASITNKRMFLKPNVFNETTYVPEKDANRKIQFETKNEYIEIDSISIALPQGYKVESLPSNKEIKSKFGTYTCKFMEMDNVIYYVRQASGEKGIYNASDYSDFYNFRNEISKADKLKIALLKIE